MPRSPLSRRAVSRARSVAAFLAPYGVMEPRRRRQAEARHAEWQHELAAARRHMLAQLREHPQEQVPHFDYELAVAALVEQDVDETTARHGSIPASSLDFLAECLDRRLGGGPALALHVGNFVGLSLAHLTATLRARHPEALVIAVDPAMPHRGVEAPDRIALRLLARFGLTRNAVAIAGFTLERNVRDDGLVLAATTANVPSVAAAAQALRADAACEDVLPNLRRLLPARFDLALLDGNHDPAYLRRELEHVDELLRPGGLLALDDVQPGMWEELMSVVDELTSSGGYDEVGWDGRVGVLARRAPAAAPVRG